MTNSVFCGIDFGTSNSSIATIRHGGKPHVIKVENQKETIPSAIFYEKNKAYPLFGRMALDQYMSGEEGRLMRSLKRVLGTDLMTSGTILNGKSVKFENILAQFIKYLKDKAEAECQEEIKQEVMGRPVHFRDNDVKGDKEAQNQLEDVARKAGFAEISFQYEPIAAAYAHEEDLQEEKLACVADIGGGTSDFSIIRLGQNHKHKTDRSEDILANSGIRIGGNDFDKDLSLSSFMPEFGFKTTYGKKNLFVPSSQYFDMSEWSKINQAYTYKNLKIIKEVLAQAHQPEKYARLLELYENQNGHRLLWHVEQSKIRLTQNLEDMQTLDFLTEKITVKSRRENFNQSISSDMEKIKDTIQDCLQQAQIMVEDINLIILTGGSTEIPYVEKYFSQMFPKAEISDKNKLISVGYGLAYDADKKF